MMALTATHFSKRFDVVGLDFSVRFHKAVFADETVTLEVGSDRSDADAIEKRRCGRDEGPRDQRKGRTGGRRDRACLGERQSLSARTSTSARFGGLSEPMWIASRHPAERLWKLGYQLLKFGLGPGASGPRPHVSLRAERERELGDVVSVRGIDNEQRSSAPDVR
jgi:hypothetical protein